jgi:hypothetical protein
MANSENTFFRDLQVTRHVVHMVTMCMCAVRNSASATYTQYILSTQGIVA